MAAGPPEAVEKCQPLFGAMGQKTFALSQDPPCANVVKLSGNFLIVSTLECMAEAFALVRKHGIDPQQYLDILANSFFTCAVSEKLRWDHCAGEIRARGIPPELGIKRRAADLSRCRCR